MDAILTDELYASLPDVLNVAATGGTVRKQDVRGMSPEDRRQLWYEKHYTTSDGGKHVAPEWPFIVDTFNFSDAEEEVRPMSVADLKSLGLTDAEMAKEAVDLGVGRAPHGDPDSPEAQRYRRILFRACSRKWFA